MLNNLKQSLAKSAQCVFLPIPILSFALSQPVNAQCVPTFSDGWLQTQERSGGHTIQRHVGKSIQELLNRLRQQQNINSASSYDHLDGASRSIQAALTANENRLNNWARNAALGQTKAVDYSLSVPVGTVAYRPASEKNLTRTNKLRVVIKKTNSRSNCIVLTSYPVR